ncbi:MAG: hypothetical protein IKZ22_05195 [Kiritimatiellae bacterium]|nr:hypothetical protein [Kiritimatiellia bacterium]
MKKTIGGLVLILSAYFAAFTANATIYTLYTGSEGGDFWSAANWKSGLPVTTEYVARLSGSETTPCTIVMTNAPNAKFAYLHVESGDWTLRLPDTYSFGGDWDNGGVRVAAGAKLTIIGGVITNTCFQASGGGQIVFNNVVTKGCLTHRRLNSEQGDREAYVFNGGVHDFATMYMRLYQRATFNAGDFRFGSIFGHDMYGEGKQSRMPSFLAVNGGRLALSGSGYLYNSSPKNVGITVSGNGWFANGASGSCMWLADGKSYLWRVEDKALVESPGIYLATGYASSTARVEVAGGRFVLRGSFGGNGPNGAGRESSVLLDGGVFDVDAAGNLTLDATVQSDTGSHYLRVGANGGCLRNRNNIILSVNRGGFSDAPGVVPGTLTLEGYGKIYLNQDATSTFSGKTKIRGLVHSDLSPCALGTGDIEIADGGCLMTAGRASNNAVSFSGASYVRIEGNGRMDIPSLTRKDNGILMLRTFKSREVFGSGDGAPVFAVGTAPAIRSNLLPVDPVVLVTSEDDNSCQEAHLVNWDSGKGCFIGAQYTTNLNDGAGMVVYQNGAVTNDSDLSVGALVLRGVVTGNNKTVTVGDGEGPAMVLLNPNSRGSSAEASNWTIQFNSARGVIAGGTKVSGVDNGSAKWNGYIKGSGGVDFAFAETGGIILYRKQDWTGGTRVLNGEVLLQSSGSYTAGFPDGEVEVRGGELSGGSVRFMTATTHTQNYTISGFGAWYSPVNKKGALSFEKDVTLSGGITIAGDAMMTATNGYTATLTGVISGQGDLYFGTARRQGAFALSGGIDLAGDLHIDTCVTNSGAIDIDGRFIYLNGTLVFNNTSDIAVNAKVIGNGRIVLAGSGKVDIADLSVFDGVVDVAGNETAALGALFGAVAVTNSAAEGGAIAVTGESDYGYFGEMSDVAKLSVSGSLVLPVETEYTENLKLALSGGTVDLLGPTVFAELSGHGAVVGSPITVTGETLPERTGEKYVLTFSAYPSLASLPYEWLLRRGKSGGATVRFRKGMVLFVK